MTVDTMKDTMKILIITSSIDYTVDYIISKYKDVNFYRLNVDLFDSYQILITNTGWSIESDTGKIEHNQVKSIYYRKPMLPCLDEFEPAYQTMIGQDIIGTINGLVDAFEGLVISKPFLLRKTENKAYQLQSLRKLQVPFPASLIGNTYDMDVQIHSDGKIIKPLTQGKVDKGTQFEFFQTSLLTKPVGDISLTPVYVQEEVKKDYEVRITCVDEYIWPVRIDTSERIDWRKATAKNKYSVMAAPEHIKDMCMRILKTFGLRFGAFDFIVKPDGEWVFLEVNPNGQWLWLEQLLGLNISEKLVELLSKGD